LQKCLQCRTTSEESICEQEEGSDQLIREKEEQNEKREWELKYEEIKGKMMSHPEAPHMCVPKDLLDQKDKSRLVNM